MIKYLSRLWVRTPLVLTAALAFGPSTRAADGTWTQLTSGGLWSVGTNWSGGTIADGSGFTANFNTLDLTADIIVRLDSARTIGNLIFGDPTIATAGSWILDNNSTVGNILTLAGATPTITVNALGAGKTVSISAVIDGTAGLRKAGVGTLVLEGANGYTGTTAVTAGILRLANTGALGGSTTVLMTSGAQLELSGGLTFGTGSTITINGQGGANFAGSLQSASGTNVWAGDVIIGSSGSRLGAQAGATLDISGVISAAAGVQLSVRNADLTGTTILSGNNTYNGATTVLGRLSVSNIGSVGSLNSNLGAPTTAANAQVNLGLGANTATLIYNGAGETTNRVIRLSATDLSGATLNQSGTGLLKFTANLSQDATAAGTRTLTLQGSTAGTGEFSGAIGNAGASAITAVMKAGSGTWMLSGANTFTGGVTISAGMLQLGSAGALNSTAGSQNAVTFSAGSTGILSLNGQSVTVSNLTSNATPGTPVVQNGNVANATLTIGNSLNAGGTFAGVIQDGAGGGSLTLIKSGSGTLTLSNGGSSFSGGTTLGDGTLIYGNVNALGSGTITFSANAILRAGVAGTLANAITINTGVNGTFDTQASNVTASGIIGGAGMLVKAGNGTLTLSNSANSLSGGITINAGTVNYSQLTALGSGAVTFAANTTLQAGIAGDLTNAISINTGVTAAFDTQANNVTLSGDITGQGQLIKKSAGILYLAGTGNTFSGGLLIENANTGIVGPTAYGVVLMAHNAAGTGPLTIGNASTATARFSLNGYNQTVSALSSGSVGIRVLEANGITGGAVSTLTVDQSVDTSYTGFLRDQNSGGGKLALIKTGVGLLDLSGAQTASSYSGGLAVNGGTLGFANTTNVGSAVIALGGGTLRYTPTATTLTLSNLVSLTAATTSSVEVVNAGSNLTFSNIVSGSGSLTKSGDGTLTLNGLNSYTGKTLVSTGTLIVGGTGRTGTGAVTVQNAGVLHGTGIVRGSSFTTQSGSNIHAGSITAPENLGTLTFSPVSGSGGFDFQTGSVVHLGLTLAGTADQIRFIGTGTNTLSFNSDLTIGPSSFTPTSAVTFQLLDWSGLLSSPIFAAHFSADLMRDGSGDNGSAWDLPDISSAPDYLWDLSQFTTNGSIAIIVVPEPSRMMLMIGGLAGMLLRRRRA